MTESTDIVLLNGIELSANIGPDWWGRVRPQPLAVSVYLHLEPAYLDKPGITDEVTDSVHYGHLCKRITSLAKDSEKPLEGPGGLARAVASAAFEFAGSAATHVRVLVSSLKMVPLAGGLVYTLTMPSPNKQTLLETVQVSITELVLSTVIGVNSPEREEKQKVVTNITVHEQPSRADSPDYSALVRRIVQTFEATSYLTLEKFVYEMLRTICLASESIDIATVRAEKPSALSFANAAGVQMTRSRSAFNA